ncbi:type II toxin-antitoxin system Phd/YefM family antitoxin [Nocardia terpenica]|nr:type II toxin-antitoxin system Phd/YefM family antitoxin [Nocardia terpenica]
MEGEARSNFAAALDTTTEDNDEVVITRSGGKDARPSSSACASGRQ